MSATVPAGLVGLFLVRLAATLLPAGALWALAEAGPGWGTKAWWLGAAVLAGFLFLRAAARTSSAVAQEREADTLETLVQSGLTSREFAGGWLQTACSPLYLELGVAAGLVLILAAVLPEIPAGPGWGNEPTLAAGGTLLAVAVLAILPWAGAWSGLGVSAESPTRRAAGGRAVGAALQGLGVWAVLATLMSAGLALASVTFRLAFGPEILGTLSTTILPAGALGLAAVWAAVSGRRKVQAHLTARWGETPEPLLEAREKAPPPPLVAPAFLAVLAVGLQVGLTSGLLLGSRLAFDFVVPWALALGAATMVAVTAGLWWLFRPLVHALADRAGRSLAGASTFAGATGALAGAILGSVPMAIRVFDTLGLLRSEGAASETQLETILWSSALGGAVAAALAAASWISRPPAPRPAGECGRPGLWPTLARTAGLGLGIAAVLAGASVVVSRQVLDVRVERPEVERSVLAATRAREEARLAVPRERDGFTLLAPVLMSRDRGRGDTPPRVRKIVEAFQALSWACVDRSGERILEALNADPERAAASAARLEEALPLLRRALARPDFVAPPRWSDQMAGQGPLIHGMITVALSAIAQEGLLDFLSRHPLQEAGCNRILQALDATTLTRESFLANLDDELAFGLRVFEDAARGDLEGDPSLEPLRWFPAAWLERERGVYVNQFLRMRDAAGASRADQVQRLAWIEADDFGPFSLSAILLPNLNRAIEQVFLACTRQEALRAVCLLQRYRARHGHYPESLEEATEGQGIRDPFTPGGRFLYERTTEGFRLRSESPVLRRLGEEDGEVAWFPRE